MSKLQIQNSKGYKTIVFFSEEIIKLRKRKNERKKEGKKDKKKERKTKMKKKEHEWKSTISF